VVVAIVLAYRRLRDPEQRRKLVEWLDSQACRPALRPVAAVVRPMWRHVVRPAWSFALPRLRFLRDRLTPGALGIEFTTACAVVVVGLYVFFAYALELDGHPDRLTPADRETLDLSEELSGDTGIEVAKFVTEVGSFNVVVAVLLLALVVLAIRRRPVELAALLLGFVAVYAWVRLAKAGVDRPRPPDPLVSVSNTSYPSGHAAYATVYPVLAVVAARMLPNLASRAALVFVAIALAVAIGLSRIYLHAHYWSDVAGGWGLGAGAFGIFGAFGLVIGYIRHNAARAAAARRPASATDHA
jgi:membrane-associated phospholipid phosphatase